MISLHEGPRIVLSVHPVSSLNGEELENLLLKTIALTEQSGRKTVYVISDNCPLNLKIYLNLNGPGNVTVLREKISFSRIYDYVYKFCNKWITENTQELFLK